VLRLGLRLVRGLGEAAGRRIAQARASDPFASVQDLAERARLDARELGALAAAGALDGLAGHRHLAAWDVSGVAPPSPLFPQVRLASGRPLLLAPSEGERIVADYRALGLSLERHPLALLRGHLRRASLGSCAELNALAHGSRAFGCGLVLVRQQPVSASGVIFVTLEDETGVVNLVVWRDVSRRYRRALLGARLLEAAGRIERQGEVVHLVVQALRDRSSLLGGLTARSRDFH
jgi:error-prone DNA polymerase